MKKCSDCDVLMIEDTSLHTDYVGGASFDERIYLSYTNPDKSKGLFGWYNSIERVKARVCPKCGKVELFVDGSK